MTNPKPTTLNLAARVTLYFLIDFGMGYHKVEATLLDIVLAKCAQYQSAVRATFVPKRARREREIVQTFQPSLVVLEGWGHPDPDGIWNESTRKAGNGVETVQGRYSSCDPRWTSDFGAKLAAYLESSGAKVLADYRGHDAMQAVERAEVAA